MFLPNAPSGVPAHPTGKPRPGVCILLENNPVPADRRVWQEARALASAGYPVSIICPKGLGFEASHETIDGIEIYRHRLWQARTKVGYFAEYLWALLCEVVLIFRVYRQKRFGVIHACNPPDHLFLLAALFKPLKVKFVFDHHDLSPELFESKFGKKRSLLYRLVCGLEYCTFRTADVSIATNESYRDIAIARGRKAPEQVFVVRSCLDLSNVRISPKKSDLKCGRRYLVVYLGVINQQDGVDLLLEAIAAIVHQQHRSDTQFSLIGSGTEIPRLKRLVVDKALDGFVTFTGWKTGQELEEYLSTADVAVAPDPATPLNDKSTMNKILHYMAYGLPIVQYDLTEGRRSAEDASLYAQNDDPQEFARKIVSLLDSESLRKELGSNGRRRIEGKLNWSNEQQELLRAYDVLLERRTDKAKADSGKSCIGNNRSATFPEVPKYVIVTPARDEQAHIEKTICAVIAQTIRPERWVIVNDGSQDGTGAIIDRYASLHPWIVPVHRANRGYRHAGGGVVDAFYDGYAQVKSMDWDFIVKLDADLGFAPDYFERCFDEFAADAQLGIAGGGIYHHASDGLKLEPTPIFHVRGATKIYRHDCWVQLGGLIVAPGWDTIDEAKANMLGWRTRTFPNLQVAHHRPTGSADGAWKDSVKNGRANYISGYHPLFMLFKCLRRLHRRPYVLGAAGLFWGFLSGYLNRTAQVEDRLLIRYIRTQQLRRMFLLGTIWR